MKCVFFCGKASALRALALRVPQKLRFWGTLMNKRGHNVVENLAFNPIFLGILGKHQYIY